jgi:hypothetical protein
MKKSLILLLASAVILGSPLVLHSQPSVTPPAAQVSHATAICSPGDQPETGMQGETPLKDIESGRNKSPYYCGMRIVGHTEIPGGASIMRRSRSCAYVSPGGMGGGGIAVVDLSNPSAPKVVGELKEPGAIGTGETFNVIDTPDRHLLVAGVYSSALTTATTPLSIYDITDCTKPKYMSTYNVPGDIHIPTITPDGKMVYISKPFGVSGVFVLDISDLAKPKYVGSFPLLLPDGKQVRCHDLTISADGTRLYCPGSVPTEAVREADPEPTVWDISGITPGKRVSGWPPIRFVAEADVKGQGDHDAPLININGNPHLVVGSELGCNINKSDFPRIFDISSGAPKMVGEFRLEVMERCMADSTFKATQRASYGLHYNSAVGDAWGKVALGMFSFQSSGVRIVDLRDPAKPREVAYYHPGAPASAPRAAQAPRAAVPSAGAAPAGATDGPSRRGNTVPVADSCMSHNYFMNETGQILFACQSGVYLAELSSEVKAYLGVDK